MSKNIYQITPECIKEFNAGFLEATNKLVTKFLESLRNDREHKLRKRLIELGWTPPDPAPECPLCGKSRTLYEHCPCETPPLKARVAQALNFHVMISNEKWCIDDIEKQIVYPIPPYDKDRDLAIGALEEYCEKEGNFFLRWGVEQSLSQSQYEIRIGDKTYYHIGPLPRAICEAIVKHSEQQ
jgi:hypothetical protein